MFRVIKRSHLIKCFHVIKYSHLIKRLNFQEIIQVIIQNYIHVQINTRGSDTIMVLIYYSIAHYSI